jgi:short-subunit dehydrogenase
MVEQKVALLLGGGSEMGELIAKELSDYLVVITSRDKGSVVGNCIEGDISSTESEQVFIECLERYQRLDLVINLVGGYASGGVNSYNDNDFNRLSEGMLKSCANATVGSYKYLSEKGVFIAISSKSLSSPSWKGALYKGFKAASEEWVRNLDNALKDSKRNGAYIIRISDLKSDIEELKMEVRKVITREKESNNDK